MIRTVDEEPRTTLGQGLKDGLAVRVYSEEHARTLQVVSGHSRKWGGGCSVGVQLGGGAIVRTKVI